jgi:hypothetical protein
VCFIHLLLANLAFFFFFFFLTCPHKERERGTSVDVLRDGNLNGMYI